MSYQNSRFIKQTILKKDVFGHIEKGIYHHGIHEETAIRRVYKTAKWWYYPIAKWLAHNERKALNKLSGIFPDQIPSILSVEKGAHIRSYIEGQPIHKKTPDPHFYEDARSLLQAMKQQGICHNDLAKEANWLMTNNNKPALVDFQLAFCFKNLKSKWLSLFSKDDHRHLLKHKRKYHYDLLTEEEKLILNNPTWLSNLWRQTGKKIYLWYTRKILGWKERQGPEERE